MSVLLLTLSLLLAQTPNDALVRAEAAAEQLEFDDAAQNYRIALEQPAGREERLRAWRGLGLSLAFMGKATEARRAFETLLLLDPGAAVPEGFGPKIERPFEAARRAVQNRKVKFTLERDRFSGELVAELSAGSLPVALINIFAREKGSEKDLSATVPAENPAVALSVDPTRDVEAFAIAEDAHGGVLLEVGTHLAPKFFKATQEPEPTHEAVRTAKELAVPEHEPEVSNSSKWPWIVGAVGVVGAGVAVGVLMSQGASGPALPAATRVERLP